MARHNYLIGHNTSPDRNKPNPSPNRPHAAEPTRKALVTRESSLGKGCKSMCETSLVVYTASCSWIKFGPSPIRAKILSRRLFRNSDVLSQVM